MGTALVILVLLLAAGLGYVRLAASDPDIWHTPDLEPVPLGEHPGTGRFSARYQVSGDGTEALARLHDIARASQRTTVLAGTVESGKVTYVTRTRLIGFPDYTTVALQTDLQTRETSLQIYARLRFGLDDLGVNRARVQDWARKAGLTE